MSSTPTPLSVSELQAAKALIRPNDRNSVMAFYGFMFDHGYDYANVANAIVACSGIVGPAAKNFLASFVQAQTSRPLTTPDAIKIEVELATAYIDRLIRTAEDSPTGSVTQDVTWQEDVTFHQQVFNDNHISLDGWILTVPRKILGDQQQRWGQSAQGAAGEPDSAPCSSSTPELSKGSRPFFVCSTPVTW